MILNSIDHLDLTDKIILLKKTETGTDSYKFRLRRVIDCGHDPYAQQYILSILFFTGVQHCQCWSRSTIEGWVSEEDAEKLLVWEALSKKESMTLWDVLSND